MLIFTGSLDRSAAAALLCQWGLSCRSQTEEKWSSVAAQCLSQVMVAMTVFSAISLLFATTAFPPANDHYCSPLVSTLFFAPKKRLTVLAAVPTDRTSYT
jgi:hypothetical protein